MKNFLKSVLGMAGIYITGKILTFVCGVPPNWMFLCGWLAAVIAVNFDRYILNKDS